MNAERLHVVLQNRDLGRRQRVHDGELGAVRGVDRHRGLAVDKDGPDIREVLHAPVREFGLRAALETSDFLVVHGTLPIARLARAVRHRPVSVTAAGRRGEGQIHESGDQVVRFRQQYGKPESEDWPVPSATNFIHERALTRLCCSALRAVREARGGAV